MKKFPHFRLEPIRLRNNKEAPTIEFPQGMLLQMIDLKKKAIARLKKEENEKMMRFHSKFFVQSTKPYEEETRFSKPNIQMLKKKEIAIQQNKSRNQEDSNDDQGSLQLAKTQTVSEYKNRIKKNNNSYLKVHKKKYISSIVQNEFKPFIPPLSYRNKIFIIEGIEEEKYNDQSRIDKRSSINTNTNTNGVIRPILEEKKKPSMKNILNPNNKDKTNEQYKERNNKITKFNEKINSLTNSVIKKERKLKIHMIKIIKSDAKKLKVILAKRDTAPPDYNSYPQLCVYHNYTFNPLIPASPSFILNQSMGAARMNLSHSLSVDQTYYYTINKSYRIQFEPYFSHRSNWVMVNKQAKQINFQWKYFCKNVDFRKCQFDPNQPLKKQMMVNLFDNNCEIGNKKNLFLNLIKYCNKINVNVFQIIPFTIILSNGKSFDQTMEALEEMMAFLSSYQLNTNRKKKDKEQEKGLFFNKLYKDHFFNDNFTSNDDRTLMYIDSQFLSQKNYWILKPVDLYKGMGIQISNNIVEMKKLSRKILIGVDTSFKKETSSSTATGTGASNTVIVNGMNSVEQSPSKEDESNPKKQKNVSHIYCSSQILIQKYLDNPLLYNKRKFDIRCYVLVDHNFNVYYCREGHLKGCSIEYDIESKSPFAHITNYSFQKNSEKFQKHELGNEMSYQNFKVFLQSENVSLTLFDAMIAKMKYAIEISMNAVGAKLNKKEKMLSFEIFGYDFIIDNDFTPWILEINNNPGLGISSPVIEKLVPRMLDDAFRLTIDTYFDTRYDASVIDQSTQLYKSRYSLEGYSNSENVFEFLCNIDH